jgi:hypothetical protein
MMIIVLIVVGLLMLRNAGTSVLDAPGVVVAELDDKINRGRKLTACTPSIADIRAGAPVNETPEMLANSASVLTGQPVDVTAYTLARVIRSERKWGGTNLEGIIIGWIARNVLESSGIERILGADGRYGKQGGTAWFSTSLDPYEIDLVIADGVLSGTIQDPTNGARNFVHPGGFASKEDYEKVKTKWMANGLTPQRFEGAPGIEVYS